MNRIADDMNCDIMFRLAKKHQDENKIKQDYALVPERMEHTLILLNDTEGIYHLWI